MSAQPDFTLTQSSRCTLLSNKRSMSANETHDHTSANYYSNDNTVGFELEKLKMTVRHLEEIIIQKDREIAAQGEIIALLKGQKEEVVGL